MKTEHCVDVAFEVSALLLLYGGSDELKLFFIMKSVKKGEKMDV